MAEFAPFDTRGYRTVDVRSGYGEWVATYEDTVQDAMDIALLDSLRTVRWADVAERTRRTIDPLVSWQTLSGRDDESDLPFEDGWVVHPPEEGWYEPTHLAALTELLAEAIAKTVHAEVSYRPVETDGAARAADLLAGDSALFCGKTCIQVHGGMGFTWEVDAQRYWKRACVLDTHFGNSDHHAAAFADSI